MGCSIWIFVIIIGICAYFLFRDDNPQHDTYITFDEPGSHRPYAGDFLPVVGDTVTGEGGYEDMDQQTGRLDSQLCEECVSHCVAMKVKGGIATTFKNDRQHCFKFCKLECDPDTGF